MPAIGHHDARAQRRMPIVRPVNVRVASVRLVVVRVAAPVPSVAHAPSVGRVQVSRHLPSCRSARRPSG
jgi:hypothetical protein